MLFDYLVGVGFQDVLVFDYGFEISKVYYGAIFGQLNDAIVAGEIASLLVKTIVVLNARHPMVFQSSIDIHDFVYVVEIMFKLLGILKILLLVFQESGAFWVLVYLPFLGRLFLQSER